MIPKSQRPRRNMGRRPGSHNYKKFHKAIDLDRTKGVVIYTDGASYNNGKKDPSLPEFSGWGMTVELEEEETYAAFGGWEDKTISVAELHATIEAIKYCIANTVTRAILVSDSQYVVKGITEWSAGWKKRAVRGIWQTSEGDLKNHEMWVECISLIESAKCELTFAWIKGHKDRGNERADFLAGEGRDKVKALGTGAGVIVEERFDNLPGSVAPQPVVKEKAKPKSKKKKSAVQEASETLVDAAEQPIVEKKKSIGTRKKPLTIPNKLSRADQGANEAHDLIKQLNRLNEEFDNRFEISTNEEGTEYTIIDSEKE
jgi:ribonuclease HI